MKREKGSASSEVVFVVIGLTLLGLGSAWLIQGSDFFMYKVFAPRTEAVRRETFEESKAYNEGVKQDIQQMMFEYAQADNSHKDALGSVILHRVADYDISRLPPEEREFISKLRTGRLEGVK